MSRRVGGEWRGGKWVGAQMCMYARQWELQGGRWVGGRAGEGVRVGAAGARGGRWTGSWLLPLRAQSGPKRLKSCLQARDKPWKCTRRRWAGQDAGAAIARCQCYHCKLKRRTNKTHVGQAAAAHHGDVRVGDGENEGAAVGRRRHGAPRLLVALQHSTARRSMHSTVLA